MLALIGDFLQHAEGHSWACAAPWLHEGYRNPESVRERNEEHRLTWWRLGEMKEEAWFFADEKRITLATDVDAVLKGTGLWRETCRDSGN